MLYIHNPSSSGDDSTLINDGRYRKIESVDKQIYKIIKKKPCLDDIFKSVLTKKEVKKYKKEITKESVKSVTKESTFNLARKGNLVMQEDGFSLVEVEPNL